MEGLRNNKLAEDLLHLALAQGASDLHIEPDGQGVRVRIRVDGLLQQLCVLPHSQQSTLLTQLKVWSGMDIAEKRVPQDGRLLLEHEGSEVDLRLSSLPTVNGEKLAIRFLQRQDNLLQVEQLQFSDDNLQRYRRLFHQPFGVFIYPLLPAADPPCLFIGGHGVGLLPGVPHQRNDPVYSGIVYRVPLQ